MDINEVKRIIKGFSDDSIVIEIAGPTIPKAAFLRDNDIELPGKVIITNTSNPTILGFGDDKRSIPVDKVVDVRKIPFMRDSVDIVICSYLTIYGNDFKPEKRHRVSRYMAFLHYKMKFISSKINLHISLFRESYKILKVGGLLIVEGLLKQDLVIAEKIGYELLHLNQSEENGTTGVFIKPIKEAVK